MNVCRADIVYLKNGRKMKGEIFKEDNKTIWLEGYGGKVGIQKSRIKRIKRGDSLEEEEPGSVVIKLGPSLEKERTAEMKKGEAKEGSAYPVNVNINPMIELDFKTKAEIYNIRKSYVLQHPELIRGDYQPAEAVFGQIQDNRPWWGILGLSYYGPGKQSLEGLSEESRFLVNPFVFVGLDEGLAYTEKNKKLNPIPIYPEASALFWSSDRALARVTYDIGSFWKKQKNFGRPKKNRFNLIAYNARDFGFNDLYVVPEKSKNIISLNPTGKPVAIRQFIHNGESCGYPGGCNNTSPDQPELKIEVTGLPALVFIKLWHHNPGNLSQSPDMIFIVDIM